MGKRKPIFDRGSTHVGMMKKQHLGTMKEKVLNGEQIRWCKVCNNYVLICKCFNSRWKRPEVVYIEGQRALERYDLD